MGPKKAVTSKGKKKGIMTKTTKPKKEKDPNAPKRPGNAFQLYVSDNKDAIKKRYPSDKVLTRASEMWSALKDKTEWEGRAKDAKEAYEEAMKDYESGKKGSKSKSTNNKKPAEAKKGKKKKKVDSDDDDITPPVYMTFSDDE